jgi:hypothetical protein
MFATIAVFKLGFHSCPKRFGLSKRVFDYQQDSAVKMAV